MIFEEIGLHHNEKNIIRLCKKLSKSCSFTKSTDVASLCELAYRLYVYGHKDEALYVCEYANIDIPEKINYNCWDFILWIWGLEAYIYSKDGRETNKDYRVSQMKKVWSTNRSAGQTEDEAWKFHQRIANRQTYESLCKQKEIENSIANNDKKRESNYRFSALYRMIAYGITGFYPALEENKEKLEKDIKEYIMHIR